MDHDESFASQYDIYDEARRRLPLTVASSGNNTAMFTSSAMPNSPRSQPSTPSQSVTPTRQSIHHQNLLGKTSFVNNIWANLPNAASPRGQTQQPVNVPSNMGDQRHISSRNDSSYSSPEMQLNQTIGNTGHTLTSAELQAMLSHKEVNSAAMIHNSLPQLPGQLPRLYESSIQTSPVSSIYGQKRGRGCLEGAEQDSTPQKRRVIKHNILTPTLNGDEDGLDGNYGNDEVVLDSSLRSGVNHDDSDTSSDGLFISDNRAGNSSLHSPRTPNTPNDDHLYLNRSGHSSPLSPYPQAPITQQGQTLVYSAEKDIFQQSPAQQTNHFNPPSPVHDSALIETSLGSGLRPSRYSGTNDLPWQRNKVPAAPSRVEKATQASLLKRGLKKGQEETVLKRGYGANDAENIEIVNLKETTNMSFSQIADYLNKKRVNDGRNPSLTMTAVNGRYNRTAPILFESQGRTFIPLSERKKNNPKAFLHGTSRNPSNLDNASWNDDLDLKLVEIVRRYEAQKWEVVRKEFEAATGLNVDDNTQLAKRFGLL